MQTGQRISKKLKSGRKLLQLIPQNIAHIDGKHTDNRDKIQRNIRKSLNIQRLQKTTDVIKYFRAKANTI